MATRIQITGFRELRKRAEKLDRKMKRRVYNRAVKAGGKVIVDASKEKVPVRTGSVKASLVHRASSKPAKGLFGVKITIKGGKRSSDRTARRGGKGAVYYPDAVERYYRFQELGTKFHPAKPFLKPALEGNENKVLDVIKRELAAGLEREAKSL